MAKQDKNSMHLTREQMERYLKGELSTREMHEVERILMDSDFYADAAEGFELSRHAGVKTDRVLTDLRHRLNQRIMERGKRKLPAWWPAWSAAAGIALAVAGYFVISYIEHENELKAMRASEDAVRNILRSIDDADNGDTLKVVVPDQDEYLASYSAYPGGAPVSATLEPVPPGTAESPGPANDPGEDGVATTGRITPETEVRLNERSAGLSVQEDSNAGIAAKQAPAAAGSRARRMQEQDTFRPDLAAYRKYLADSLRYPAQALENKTEGRVELSFRVDENGRPADIRVEESLGDGCDQEAIRLIREGPDWQAPGDGSRVKQPVMFKLPSKE